MLNILITGANGQLGNEMRLRGAASKDNYLFTDVAELDITDGDAIRRVVTEQRIDVIVNCAAYTDVERAEENPALADLLNHRAPQMLARSAAEAGALLIHISTDYVFGGTAQCTPFSEQTQGTPIGVYGRTKLLGERAIEESGCRYLIFRTAWLYSPYGKNFLKTMLRLTAEKERLNVVFDQVGTPTYAADLADLIYTIIEERSYEGREGIYHFSNEGVCSWYDFATEIARAAGNACAVQPCHSSEFPSKVTRPSYSVLDKSKVKRTFGVKIPYWRDSMLDCMRRLAETDR